MRFHCNIPNSYARNFIDTSMVYVYCGVSVLNW